MLVLGRRESEKIIIGEDIEVMVIAVKSNGTVRIGVKAPREIRVMRDELLNREERKDEQAN